MISPSISLILDHVMPTHSLHHKLTKTHWCRIMILDMICFKTKTAPTSGPSVQIIVVSPASRTTSATLRTVEPAGNGNHSSSRRRLSRSLDVQRCDTRNESFGSAELESGISLLPLGQAISDSFTEVFARRAKAEAKESLVGVPVTIQRRSMLSSWQYC